jgi:hypothetical protein
MTLKYIASYVVTFDQLVQRIKPADKHRHYDSIIRTTFLGSAHSLTELITSNISWE